MLASTQHQAECPGCQLAFDYSKWAAPYPTDEGELLRRVISEPEPFHVCPGCGARIRLGMPLVFRHRGLGVLAYVGSNLHDVIASWREEMGDDRDICPIFVNTRAALKHAILRAADFAPELASLVPAEDLLWILALGFSDDDWERLDHRKLIVLGEGVELMLKQSFEQSLRNRKPFQVRLRGVLNRLHRLDLRFPAVAQISPDQLLQRQFELLQELGNANPDQWEPTLAAKLDVADPAAIQVCWENAKAYRLDRNTFGAAKFMGQLGLWLAYRFGNTFEQAESAYQYAAAFFVAERHKAAFEQFEAALHLYLESISWHQPLECFKQLGDLCLDFLNDASKAQELYEDGIALASKWRLNEHSVSMSANLARAAFLAGDPETGKRAALGVLARSPNDTAQGRGIRIVALDALRHIRQTLEGPGAALETVRQMFEEIRAGQDWHTLAYLADSLIEPAVATNDWSLADEILTEALNHLPDDASGKTESFQPDAPQLLTGSLDFDQRLKLWTLGGMLAAMNRCLPQAIERFQAAAKLAESADRREELADLQHRWAGVLSEAGQIEEAIDKEEQFVSHQTDITMRARRCVDAANNFFIAAREHASSATGTAQMGIEAARAALAFYEKAESFLQATPAPQPELKDLHWCQCTTAAFLAWQLRREGHNCNASVEQGARATQFAQRNGETACLVESLEALQICWRDAGQMQHAVDVLCKITELLVASHLHPIRGRSRRRTPTFSAVGFTIPACFRVWRWSRTIKMDTSRRRRPKIRRNSCVGWPTRCVAPRSALYVCVNMGPR
jgi:tetratricopeptide (TPR) repeat protein